MDKYRFNIRVYGIITDTNKKAILVTDEFQRNMLMTKFPGGGLHFGEGTIECLRREMEEELQVSITNVSHFYTTDFFQKDHFTDYQQIISIYYFAQLDNPIELPTSEKPLLDSHASNGTIAFRWLPISKLKPSHFTFPIDKHVVKKLLEFFKIKEEF